MTIPEPQVEPDDWMTALAAIPGGDCGHARMVEQVFLLTCGEGSIVRELCCVNFRAVLDLREMKLFQDCLESFLLFRQERLDPEHDVLCCIP